MHPPEGYNVPESHASCRDTRHYLAGYYILLGDALVFWKTKKQNVVSRSTVEDFGVSVPTTIPFLSDNRAALHIVTNPVFHGRTKHSKINCHIVRDKFKFGLIAPSHVSSKAQIADMFTKSLLGPSFFQLLSKLGLVGLTPSLTCGGFEGINMSCQIAISSLKSFSPIIR
ncbi:hypothetical protein Sango_1273200 [Sesamum angolense]|uniref:Copia protein n=1 Tax=Sesamum angolense TaxID=2727404 RepID=A0AAE1WRL1_9LAMI|nr:hypothetical protein Sango_1273200 [Sesamum angolense]